MHRIVALIAVIVFITQLFSACGRNGKGGNTGGYDTIALRYADNLLLLRQGDCTLAILRNPWDTLQTLHTYVLVPKGKTLPSDLPEGTLVRTPLSCSVVYSSVHCSLLQMLGVMQNIGGICDLEYIHMPEVKRLHAEGNLVDCGNSMAPDVEKIIDLHPDAVLLSPFENSGGYGRVEKLGIPLIECADYMETSPLGRAEWMRFYGLLFGVEHRADSLFAVVDSCYRQLAAKAGLSSSSLSVFSELKNGSAWYVPGGRSTMGQLFRDACGRYAFADDGHSGSIPLAFETVFDRAGEADVWIIKYSRPQDLTYTDLAADYAPYTAFKAFKSRCVYGCNTSRVAYYEETPFRPDYLLSDYIQILHPEMHLSGGLRYFSKLCE